MLCPGQSPVGVEHVDDADMKPHQLKHFLQRLLQEFGEREGGCGDTDDLVEDHELLIPVPELLFRPLSLGYIQNADDRAAKPTGLIGGRRCDHERMDPPTAAVAKVQFELLPPVSLPAEQVL